MREENDETSNIESKEVPKRDNSHYLGPIIHKE